MIIITFNILHFYYFFNQIQKSDRDQAESAAVHCDNFAESGDGNCYQLQNHQATG